MAQSLDIALTRTVGALYDIRLDGSDVASADNLHSAAVLSVLTHLRNAGERGYWNQDNYGSLLWTLERRLVNEETATLVRQYIREALQWMIDTNAVQSVEVRTELRRSENRIDAEAELTTPSGRVTLVQFTDAIGHAEPPAPTIPVIPVTHRNSILDTTGDPITDTQGDVLLDTF